ncbi:MAG: hypothetical protein UHW99_04430 [Methanobrevibacter sp.]|nr:hypothetical protein [Methanobrevibacter sp.]
MSRKVLSESECDYSIYTQVNLGKRIKDVPKGWALNLMDIREFIPVLRYEFECFIKINGIISPCKIRINPRLFYSGIPLRNHLRRLKNNHDDMKVPIEIKFNKGELDKTLDNFDKINLDYIDTKLLVGKSYNSKGWALPKDVVSKILPLDAYNYMFPVYIDGIPAETRLNMQTRLFYNGHELSSELEKLYKIDSKQKVNARIILNEKYLDLLKSIEKDRLSDRRCIICGNFIDSESKNDKCFDCLDKELTVLKLKNILTYFGPKDVIYEENLLELGFTKGNARIIFSKLEKYHLVSRNWDGSYELTDNLTLNQFIKDWG